MKERSGSGDRTVLFARLILWGFLAGAIHIFLHELGHGLVALAAGSKILRFSVFHGYVVTEGGEYGIPVRQLFYAAGVSLPYLTAVLLSLFYRRGKGEGIRCFAFLYEAVCAAASCDWIVTPVLALFRRAPAGDDCTLFLLCFRPHPLVLSGIALAAAVFLVFLAQKRGIGKEFMQTVQNHLDKRG